MGRMNDHVLYRFLRDSHTFGALVRSLLEEGYLREAVGREVTFTQLSVLRMVEGAGRLMLEGLMMEPQELVDWLLSTGDG